MANDQLDNAQLDAGGHPECGDEYCPGFPDCPACSQLRDQEWQRHETGRDEALPPATTGTETS